MLVKVTKSGLSEAEIFKAVFVWRWSAVDVETGARLSCSNGRPKYGNARKWFLILPGDGKLWDSRVKAERAIFRAESEEEAIRIGNEKLPKLIQRKEKKARGGMALHMVEEGE